MAQRELGPGQLTLRAMFSLEPATITGERYPLLFQQGETAYGVPIADGQHPHDFFMEIAGLYDIHLGRAPTPQLLLCAHRRPRNWPDGLPASRIRIRESSRYARPSSGGFDAHCE